jgi:hypothetical protein
MIKVEARSPSPAQLKHRAAPPERARTIHPVSYSNFRIVSAEARSDAPLATLLDAAYRENDSLREEIRQREEREKRILGLLLWHEQAVQKSGKEGTTPCPSSGQSYNCTLMAYRAESLIEPPGLYATNPQNPSQDKVRASIICIDSPLIIHRRAGALIPHFRRTSITSDTTPCSLWVVLRIRRTPWPIGPTARRII